MHYNINHSVILQSHHITLCYDMITANFKITNKQLRNSKTENSITEVPLIPDGLLGCAGQY